MSDPRIPDAENDPVVDRVDDAAAAAESSVKRAQLRAEQQVHETSEKVQAQVRRTEQQVKDKVRETETKVRRQVEEVQRTVGEIKGLSDPTPAGSVDEATQQASELRRAIDRDLDALQTRLPPGDELAEKAKKVGGAALAVLGVVAAIAVGAKQRGERKRVEREAKAHAAAIARYLPQAASQPRPEPSGGNKGKLLLVIVGAAAAAFAVSRAGGDDAEEPDIWGPAT